VARLAGLPQLGRGQQIELQITGADELALELEARYVSLLDAVIEASEMAEEREPNQPTVNEVEIANTAMPVASPATHPPESLTTCSALPPPVA
jgi:hypothetical protein